MGTLYDQDIAAWAREQAALLRDKQWDRLDVEHIAEEIAELSLSDRHELAHRFSILLCHLLKWQRHPERRGRSWTNTIRDQRESIVELLTDTPSLRHVMEDAVWQARVWRTARIKAVHEAGFEYDDLPGALPWTLEQVRAAEFFPGL